MKKLSKKLVISVLAIVFAIAVLGTTTFAWFVSNNQAKAEKLTFEVQTSEGDLLISLDGVEYFDTVTAEDINKLIGNTDESFKWDAVTYDKYTTTDHYIVTEAFTKTYGPYAENAEISADLYKSLTSEQKALVTVDSNTYKVNTADTSFEVTYALNKQLSTSVYDVLTEEEQAKCQAVSWRNYSGYNPNGYYLLENTTGVYTPISANNGYITFVLYIKNMSQTESFELKQNIKFTSDNQTVVLKADNVTSEAGDSYTANLINAMRYSINYVGVSDDYVVVNDIVANDKHDLIAKDSYISYTTYQALTEAEQANCEINTAETRTLLDPTIGYNKTTGVVNNPVFDSNNKTIFAPYYWDEVLTVVKEQDKDNSKEVAAIIGGNIIDNEGLAYIHNIYRKTNRYISTWKTNNVITLADIPAVTQSMVDADTNNMYSEPHDAYEKGTFLNPAEVASLGKGEKEKISSSYIDSGEYEFYDQEEIEYNTEAYTTIVDYVPAGATTAVELTFWVEGWDYDCFDALLETVLSIDIHFKAQE